MKHLVLFRLHSAPVHQVSRSFFVLLGSGNGLQARVRRGLSVAFSVGSKSLARLLLLMIAVLDLSLLRCTEC